MNEFIYIASLVIFGLVLLFSILINYRQYMHMFQLGSYHATEQFKWIGENIQNVILRHLPAALAIVYLCIFSHNELRASDLLCCSAFICIGLAFFKKKPEKKKLVFTPRVIRMCVTSTVVYAVIAGFAISLIQQSYICFIILCLLQIIIPILPIIANIINKPIEALINKYYIDDAKRIINELPNLVVIGITGSYGKTSTKYYLQKLLSVKYNVLMTPESFNTTMGVVKTIRSSLNATHEIFICEMGAKGVGEIKEICDIVHPKHSMITSIGPQHLESFKSLENIIKTKFEISDCITDGLVFLNYDNEYIRSKNINKAVVSYGIKGNTDYYADKIDVSARGTSFVIHHNDASAEFSTKLIGEHNVQNIVGAIAIANTLGIPLELLKAPVRRLECAPHRMQIIDRGDSVIIDDAFNSNPAGAKAALAALSMMDGMKILITPGMVELGEQQYDLNKQLGKQAAAICDFVAAVGERQAPPIVEGLNEVSYPKEKIYVARDLNDALAKVNALKSENKKKIILLENDLPDNY